MLVAVPAAAAPGRATIVTLAEAPTFKGPRLAVTTEPLAVGALP